MHILYLDYLFASIWHTNVTVTYQIFFPEVVPYYIPTNDV